MQSDDNDFLSSLGINDVADDNKEHAENTLLQVLNARVGNRVVGGFNEDQLKEFDELTSEYELDDKKLADWFEKNVPDYKQIVTEEAKALRDENMQILGNSDEEANDND